MKNTGIEESHENNGKNKIKQKEIENVHRRKHEPNTFIFQRERKGQINPLSESVLLILNMIDYFGQALIKEGLFPLRENESRKLPPVCFDVCIHVEQV